MLQNFSDEPYYRAIGQWESFAIDITIGLDLLKWFNGGQGVFSKNDGSKERRLYEIGNKVKHMPSCVDSGQCTAADTLPLWINGSGLNSFGVAVSFPEAAEVLTGLCETADELWVVPEVLQHSLC